MAEEQVPTGPVISPLSPTTPQDQRLKKYVNWVFFGGAALYSIFHAGFVIWNTVRGNDRFINMVYDHFGAIVGLLFTGFAALGLVLLLESRSEQPLEFTVFRFTFKGASGPIVLWVLCFLAIVVAFKVMW